MNAQIEVSRSNLSPVSELARQHQVAVVVESLAAVFLAAGDLEAITLGRCLETLACDLYDEEGDE